MASVEEQSERIKMSLTLWARQGATLAAIGARVADDDQQKKLAQLGETIAQVTEQIEKL